MTWNDVKTTSPQHNGFYRVKLENGDEVTGTFWKDGVMWRRFYGLPTGYWWNESGDKPIDDKVIEWIYQEEKK